MKKKITIVIAIIAALLLLSPYLIALWIKGNQKTLLTNGIVDHYGQLQVVSFHQGYFKTDAKYQFVMTLPNSDTKQASKKIVIPLKVIIQHGPFIREKVNGKNTWRFALAKVFFQGTNPMWPISGDTEVGGFAFSKGVLKAPFFDIKSNDQQMTLKDVVATWKVGSSKKQMELKAGVITLASPKNQVNNLKATNFTYSLNLSEPNKTWLGYQSVSISKLHVELGKNSFSTKDLAFSFNQIKNQDKLNISFDLSGSDYTQNKRNAGPLSIKLDLDGVDLNAMSQLYAARNAAQPNAQQINKNLFNLLQQGLALRLNTFQFDGVHAQGFLQLSEMTGMPFTPQNLQKSLSAKLNIKMVKTLLDDWIKSSNTEANEAFALFGKPRLSFWMQKNFLMPKNNHYVMHLDYKGSVLKVNDKRVDFSALLGASPKKQGVSPGNKNG